MQVEIYGASDDLIEVEGDMTEEYGAYSCANYLHFGDGTILEVEYNPTPNHYWRIKVLKVGEGTELTRLPGTYDGDEEDVSCDRVRLIGDLKSVECWNSTEGATRDDLEMFIDQCDLSELSDDKLKRIVAITKE